MSVAFNGVVLVAPGVASYIDDSASSSSPTTTANAIAILGESERGETGQPVVFTDSSAVRAYYGTSSVDLPLIYGITRAMNAGASRVYGLRVGNATKASVSIKSGNQNLINILTKEWGNTGNAWNLEITTNASDPLAKDIKLTLHDGRVYRQTKIGKNVAQIEYFSPVYSLGTGTISPNGSISNSYVLSVAATQGVEVGSVLSATGAGSDNGSFGSGKCVVTAVNPPTWLSGAFVPGTITFTSTVTTNPGAPRGAVSGIMAQKTTAKDASGGYTFQPAVEIAVLNGVANLRLYTPGEPTPVAIPLQPYDTLAKLTARVNQYFVVSKAGQAAIPQVVGSAYGSPLSANLQRLGVTEDSGSVVFGITDSGGGNRSSVSVPYTKTMLLSEFRNAMQDSLRAVNNNGLVGPDSLVSATVDYLQRAGTASGKSGPSNVTTPGTAIITTASDGAITGASVSSTGWETDDLATLTQGTSTATIKYSGTAWSVISGGTGFKRGTPVNFTGSVSGGTLSSPVVTVGGGGSNHRVGDVLSTTTGTNPATVTVASVKVLEKTSLTGTTIDKESNGATPPTYTYTFTGGTLAPADLANVATGDSVSVSIGGTSLVNAVVFSVTGPTADPPATFSLRSSTSATTLTASTITITSTRTSVLGAAATLNMTAQGTGLTGTSFATVDYSSIPLVPVKPVLKISTGSAAKFYSLAADANSTILNAIGLAGQSSLSLSSITGVSFDTPLITFRAMIPAVSSYGWKFGIAPGMADGTLSSSKLDMCPKTNVYTTAAMQEDPNLGKTYFSANTNALVDALNGSIFGALIEATKVYSSSRIDNGVYAFGGAIETPVEPSHWDEALAKLQQLEDLEIIVPMTPNASIQSATLAHCLSMSGPLGKRERFAVFGGGLGQSTADVSTLASQFNDKRAVLVWPGVKDYDESGNVITWAPYFAAATIAGQLAAQADIAEPLTNKSVSVRGLETIPRLNDIDALINAGVLVIRYDSNRGYSVAQSLTTWSGDTRYVRREISTMRSADTVMRRVRASIANIVGSKLTPDLLNTIRARITTQLQLAENGQIIVGSGQFPAFKDILVRAVGDAIYAEFSISPAIPANYLLITAHIM
ncbi:MAG: hypothetical protein EBY23_02230 [Actinobacteria bacterium]|nr:hypothetical protein [Actinomycetota bacterium]